MNPTPAFPFRTLGKLGEGGMGTVYRVEDPRLGRQAALKIVNDSGDELLVARFVREGRVTAKLDHPGVPPVFEAGVTPQGQPYLLLRVIEGQPLSERIKAYHARGEGNLEQLLEALIRVAETVSYAHSTGVVHRDLKPDNIMVGRFGEVMVLDWGVAKLEGVAEPAFMKSGVEQSNLHLTQYGSCVGTPGYLSPEQAAGEGLEGPPADVFGLGAILTAILTGRPPVEGTTALNRIVATVDGRIRRPRDIDRGVPADLDQLAAHALALDPQKRLAIPELIAGLRAYLSGRPVPGARYSLLRRLLLAVRRRPAVFVASGALVLLVLGGGGSVVLVKRAEREADLAAEVAAAREDAARLDQERAQAVQARAEEQRLAAQSAREQSARTEAGLRAERERFARVLEHLQAARRLSAGSVRPEVLEAEISAALEAARQRPEVVLEAVRIYGHAGHDKTALRLLRARLEAEPSPDLLMAAHRVAFGLGMSPAETGWLAKVSKKLGTKSPFHGVVEAAELMVGGDVDGALRKLEEAERDYPRNAFLHLVRARCLLRKGDHEAGLRAANRALTLFPNWGPAYVTRGMIRASSDPLAAIRDFDTALRLDPRDAEASLRRAISRFLSENLAGAEADSSVALKYTTGVKRRAALLVRARIRVEMGLFKGAKEDLAVYTSLRGPHSSAYALCRARLSVEDLDLAQARVALERAIRAKPRRLELHLELAFVLLYQGEWTAAKALFLRLEAPLANQARMIPLVLLALGERRPGMAEDPGWPGSLARYLSGQISAETLLKLAHTGGGSRPAQLCEAFAWIGMRADRAGRTRSALEAYRRSLDIRHPDFLEYKLARARVHALTK
jgi:tetratricopeptide (TPR) repeat protein